MDPLIEWGDCRETGVRPLPAGDGAHQFRRKTILLRPPPEHAANVVDRTRACRQIGEGGFRRDAFFNS